MLKNPENLKIINIINKEVARQQSDINLIASENYVDPIILEITGSVLTNKYAEGYPKKRYYGGCKFVDEAELLGIKYCKELFKAEYANIQPHSGSQANLAAYFSLINPGDTILGMSLSDGGHLTHGHKVSFSGKFYNSISYGVDPKTEMLNYDHILELAKKYNPKLIVCGASAYSKIIDFKKLSEIAKSVNAYLLADIAHIAGLVATGLHPSPLKYADIVTSTTHKTLRGPRGGVILSNNKELGEKIDKAVMPGTQGGPLMHVIAAKAAAFELALKPEFKEYQKQILKNSKAMANKFMDLGYKIVSNGTDNHLFMIDLRPINSTGTEIELLLSKIGITVNRNSIPNDPQKPWITSGIRIGTPAITTKGFKEPECIEIVNLIHEAIINKNNINKLNLIKEKALNLAKLFKLNYYNLNNFNKNLKSLNQL